MKLNAQRSIVLGSALACLAMTGLGFSQLQASGTSQTLALQDRADEPEPIRLGHGYERRGDFIYFNDERIDQAGRADLHRFEQRLGRRVQPANDIDVASFEVLSEQYTKDEFAVYYKWISPGWYCIVEIVGADPATFEALDLDLARDARHVFRADEIFPAADPATAEVVTPNFVWRDRNTVYYNHIPMENADPKTFRHLDQAFYRDEDDVYWGFTRLIGADPDTFRTFGDVPYAVDKDLVWITTSGRDDLDAASFRLYANHVFSDKNGVYVTPAAHKVRGADVESFKKVGPVGELGCTLFRDRDSLFVLEPGYNEIYRLSKEAGEIVVSKDAWVTRHGKIVLGANTTAMWTGEAFSNAVAKVAPGFARTGHVYAVQEEGKIERLGSTLKAAIEQTGFDGEG
jgi:hypothetical protein